MAFVTFCVSKTCRQEMEPVIDKETDNVHCSVCDTIIPNIDQFMKRQMVSIGQVKKVVKSKSSYALECKFCKVRERPVLRGNKVFCSKCKEDITATLSAPYIQMLKSI